MYQSKKVQDDSFHKEIFNLKKKIYSSAICFFAVKIWFHSNLLYPPLLEKGEKIDDGG